MLRIQNPGQATSAPPTADVMPEELPPAEVTPISPDMPDMMESGEDKASQQVSGYMGPESGPFECEHCHFWQAPNACKLVADEIDPHGVCNLYTPGEQRQEPELEAEMPQEAAQPIPEEMNELPQG